MSTVDLTRALQQVYLGSLYDPNNSLKALFNPASLRVALGVNIGKLHPVGSSRPVLQYGYTESVSIPLEFYFSVQLLQRLSHAQLDLTYYMNWFSSFCYPTGHGEAPDLLYFVWPNVLQMALAVEKFNGEYTRFYRNDLRASAVKISIDALEYGTAFKSADQQEARGFMRADPIVKKYYGTGAPLTLRKSQ